MKSKEDKLNEIKNKEGELSDILYLKFNSDSKAMLNFKQENYNNCLADHVLRNNDFKKLIVQNNEIVRKAEPIYFIPSNSYGRAHFYSPVKRLGNLLINTKYFNMAIIWIMSLALYFLLIVDGLSVSTKWLGNLKL